MGIVELPLQNTQFTGVSMKRILFVLLMSVGLHPRQFFAH